MVFPKRKVGAVVLAVALALGLSPTLWSGSGTSGKDTSGVSEEYYWQVVQWHIDGTPITYDLPHFNTTEEYWEYYLDFAIYYW